MIGLNTITWIQ